MKLEELFRDKYPDINGLGYVVEIFDNGKNSEYIIGDKSIYPNKVKTSRDTLYDMASITKMFTATLVYMAYEENLLDLNQTIFSIDDRFSNLKDVTVYELLGHTLEVYTDGYLGDAKDREDFEKILFSAHVVSKKAKYVDAHYMILSFILEKIYKMSFKDLVEEKISKRLGLKHTTFTPDEEKCAPCNYEYKKEYFKPGFAHDMKARRAREVGLFVGHAGLFSTGEDILKFLKSFLDCTLLKKETIKIMLQKDDNDSSNEYNHMSCRCRKNLSKILENLSDNAITYSGFTGPMFGLDFDKNLIVLVMCNIPHYAMKKNTRSERRKLIIKFICNIIEVISENKINKVS